MIRIHGRREFFSSKIDECFIGKILYRVGTGAYNFNPYLFGKGDWQDVSRLRLEVNYNEYELVKSGKCPTS